MSAMPEGLFKTGAAPKATRVGAQFLRWEPEETKEVVLLSDLGDILRMRVHEHWNVKPAVFHPCIAGLNLGECPGCSVGNKAKSKHYVYAVVKGEKTPAVWAFGPRVFDNLSATATYVKGELRGRRMAVKRTGKGFNTNYVITLIPGVDKIDDAKLPEPDTRLEEIVGRPWRPGDIVKRLEEANIMGDWDGVDLKNVSGAPVSSEPAKVSVSDDGETAFDDGDADDLWE